MPTTTSNGISINQLSSFPEGVTTLVVLIAVAEIPSNSKEDHSRNSIADLSFSLIERVRREVRRSADDIGWLQRAPDMPPVKDMTERFSNILKIISYDVHMLPITTPVNKDIQIKHARLAVVAMLIVYFEAGKGKTPLGALDELREELEILLRDGQVSCLITDALWHFTQSVADSLNLPRLVLRTSSLFCFLIYASIPLFDDHGYFELSDNHLEEHQVVEFPMLKVKDILKMGFKGKNDIGGELIGNMVKQTKVSSGIIWNSIKELEEPELGMMLRDFPVPSFIIPFPQHLTASSSSLLKQDRTFFPWLDQQPPNSVLYVSFGSVTQVEEKDFLEIAHGLVNSKQAFVWVVRPGFIKGSDWLEPFPDGFVGERG
ncbi:hypothetical protein Tco_0158521 [Tanacetum coccineum]